MANSAKKREELEKLANTNRQKNEKYIDSVAGKRRIDRRDMQKLKLHEMQKGECLYTGQPISTGMLFDGSVAVDHILPRAITMDDGINNLALVLNKANDFKAKRTPFDAFSNGYQGQSYANILDRAQKRGKGFTGALRKMPSNDLKMTMNFGPVSKRYPVYRENGTSVSWNSL